MCFVVRLRCGVPCCGVLDCGERRRDVVHCGGRRCVVVLMWLGRIVKRHGVM